MVKQAYKVGSSTFKVHYLAHEAQHFADYKTYPKLSQEDLEYRAKLAELSLTRSPKRFIQKLRSEAKDDRKLPHGFAAYKILEGLGPAGAGKSARKRGVELLKAHSCELKILGAKGVKTALR